MKRCYSSQVVLVVAFCMATTLGCLESNLDGPPKGEKNSTDVVTRYNSSKYAKDYDAIDTLDIVVEGAQADANGYINWDKKRWHVILSSADAGVAHALLQELLRDHPLRRSFRGTQTRYRTAADFSISFYRRGDTNESVFDIKIFAAGYLEIEHRIRLQGSGLAMVPVGLGGTSVPLEGEVKTKIFSFLANCAARTKEDGGPTGLDVRREMR